MTTQRRKFGRKLNRAFKAKVALVAVKGEKALAEWVAARPASDAPPNRFSRWHDQPVAIHLS